MFIVEINNKKKERLIFYSDYGVAPSFCVNVYFFEMTNVNKEQKLPFLTRSDLTWCIWKHFILFLHISFERICSYDILTGKVEDNFDFRGIEQSKLRTIKFPICNLISWKNKLYIIDISNNLYIYK